MPELPEVETVRRGLAEIVVGRRIDRVEVGRPRTVRRTSPQAVIDGLTGAVPVDAQRRGKYLVCPLDTGDAVMIHLRMSGQLLVAPVGSPRPPHTHVVLDLGDRELRFVDPRTFGEIVVFDPDRVDVEAPELARLGVDPVVDGLDAATLGGLLARTGRAVKVALMDQHLVAGLGNIYSDEVLHRAGVRPDRPARELGRARVARLADAIVAVLAEAIEAGGSTLADAQYVDLMGRTGRYQDQHHVYGQAGEPCPTCGRGEIRRVVLGGRSAYYCARCQR